MSAREAEDIKCPVRVGSRMGMRDVGYSDHWLRAETQWKAGTFPMAVRVCSYCSSVHPEDAWTLYSEHAYELTGSEHPGKRYFQAPGFYAAIREIACGEDTSPPHIPGPPVKLYFAHFSEEQMAAWNAAVAIRRAKAFTAPSI
jgi:hypothetical protein